MRLVPHDSWGDRMAAAVRSSDSNENWIFFGSCVEIDGETISYILGAQESISLIELREKVDLSSFEESLGYEESGLSLEKDKYVSYGASYLPPLHAEYPAHPCVFLQHSSIEYIWVHVRD